MKKLTSFTALVIVLLMTACSEQPGYLITGTVSNADLNGNYVFLYPFGNNATPLDSTLIENNAFTFKGIQDSPMLCTIRLADGVIETQRVGTGEQAPYTATVILDNSKLKVELSEVSSVTGSPENEAFGKLQKEIKNLRAESKQLAADMLSEDKNIVETAEKRYEEIENYVLQKAKQYIASANDNLTSAKLLSDFRYNLDEAERREIIAKSGDTFKSLPGIDRIIEHLNTLEKVAIGKKFTDFEMADPEGNMHKLSEYAGNGKVVLIDFWASWCPPCRRDMPHLVKVYKQYKGKDFEIVGVSLDRTNDAWKKGIEDLGITWPQMSDLKYWESEGAALYGVNSIPHTVLVGKDGIIIAKNLRGEALDAKLAEIIK